MVLVVLLGIFLAIGIWLHKKVVEEQYFLQNDKILHNHYLEAHNFRNDGMVKQHHLEKYQQRLSKLKKEKNGRTHTN